MKKITWAILLLIFITFSGRGQDKELAPVTGTVAISNVTIIPKPGEVIDNGTVLIKDGLIEAVGRNISVPAGARIVKADSMYLYPGFVLGLSHAGVKIPENKEDRNTKIEDPGNPPNDLAGITPERKVHPFLDMDEKAVADWREAGFTVSQVVPKGGMLPGTGSIILLGGNHTNPILKSETGLFSTFEGARRMYPATVLGVMAHYRQLYLSADQSMKYAQTFKEDPSGRKRPVNNITLEAFYPVIKQQMPVYFETEEVLEAQRAMLLKKDLGFNLVLSELKEGWDLMNDIKSSGTRVQFSLDMPEWDEKKKDSTKKEEESSVEKIGLEKRRKEFLKKYYGQMSQFASAGIPFSFSGLEVKPKDIQKNLQKIVEQGLSPDAALAALTMTPAQQFGLEKTIGSVEKGKLANLLISNKPYFEKDAKIKYVMVDGKLYEYDLKESKKADPKDADIVSGEWTYSTETPGGNMTGNIVIKKEGESFSGTIYSDNMGQENELRNIEISGNNLSFNFEIQYQGQNLDLMANLEISDDSYEGVLSIVGMPESFPIEGSKVPKSRF